MFAPFLAFVSLTKPPKLLLPQLLPAGLSLPRNAEQKLNPFPTPNYPDLHWSGSVWEFQFPVVLPSCFLQVPELHEPGFVFQNIQGEASQRHLLFHQGDFPLGLSLPKYSQRNVGFNRQRMEAAPGWFACAHSKIRRPGQLHLLSSSSGKAGTDPVFVHKMSQNPD